MAWDKTKIAEGVLAPDLNDEIRANWVALEAALDAWIRFATGGTQTGQPRQGSARPYFQDSAPTVRLDGNYFDSTDLGTPWIDSNGDPDNQVNILTAADGAGTETWTPVSTEIIAALLAANRIFAGTLKSTGNFTVGANKLTVAAATGNTAVAGTLNVTGIATLGAASLLKTSAAPTTNPMIVNKKYVDDQDTADHPAYSGGESHTDGSGLVIKTGSVVDAATSGTVTFGSAFGTACVSVIATVNSTATTYRQYNVSGITAAGFDWKIETSQTGFCWIAIGH